MPNDVVPRRPNRLIHEASPYLRQHAGNPVDWYPWGPEALERAREEDRPIFLSVGYSACHWCHVMAHECFEDEAIARKLNEAFVCVKVDREERPDVDQAYQAVCQALTGQGGWPLTVVLTPDLQPFYAGTYIPPAPRYGRPGLPQVIEACARAYRERPEEVRRHAARLAGAVRHALDPWGTAERDGAVGVSPGQATGSSPERGPQARVLVVAADRLLQDADERAGGFGRAPKFPQPAALDLLARAAWRHGHRGALEHLERTLVCMTRGGIFDQVGGGFHRYAVDRWWKVPHFEKMLCDNALLLPLLVQLGLWRRPGLLEAAARTGDFLLDGMRLEGGGFAASLDADSPDEEGRPAEGAFYRWHPHELVEALGGKELAARVGEALAIRSGDAAQDESLASRIGQLALDAPPGWAEEAPAVPGALPWEPGEAAAAATGRDDGSLREALGRMAAYRRERRRPPARDEKVIAGWHALALSALVWGFRAGLAGTREPQRYMDAAREGFAFVEEHLLDGGGSWLLHTPRRGAGAVPGYCDDYAWTVHAALDLFTATQERAYLHRAQELMHAAGQRFREGGHGLYFLSGAEHASPLGRARDIWDQATPSANAAMAAAHARLGAILDAPEHRAAGMEVVEAAWPMMLQHVSGTAGLWCALDRLDGGMATVTLRSRHLDEVRADLQRLLALPHPALDARWEPAEGVPSFLVCVGSTCDLPRESVEEALARLAPAPRVSHP